MAKKQVVPQILTHQGFYIVLVYKHDVKFICIVYFFGILTNIFSKCENLNQKIYPMHAQQKWFSIRKVLNYVHNGAN